MEFRIVLVHYHFYWNVMEYVPKYVKTLKKNISCHLGEGTNFMMVLSNTVLLLEPQTSSTDLFWYVQLWFSKYGTTFISRNTLNLQLFPKSGCGSCKKLGIEKIYRPLLWLVL